MSVIELMQLFSGSWIAGYLSGVSVYTARRFIDLLG